MKFKYALTIVCLFAVFTLTSAYAQDIWNGGTGNWSYVANWSAGFVPNGSTVDVRIDGGNPINSVVTFDLSGGSVGTLLLDADDTLNIDGALTSYFATLISGTLSIDSGGTLNNNGLLNNYNALNNLGGTLNNNGTITDLYGNNLGTINNNGTITGWALGNVGGTINNNGTITDLYGNFSPAATINNNGLIEAVTLNNYGTLDNYGGLEIRYFMENYRTLNNYGSLSDEEAGIDNNPGATLNNFGGIDNSGMLSTSGTLENYGGIDNSGFMVNGGTLNNPGTLYNSGALANYGALNNSGTLNNDSTLENDRALNNSGTLNDNFLLFNSGTISNAGVVVIAPGAILTNVSSSATYVQWAGSTVVDGAFSSVTPIQINGGTLSGSGVIQGDVTMGGIMSPGDSPGVLTIQGNYTQLTGGTFFAELAGLTPGTQYDQLVVSGLASLDGRLDVVLLNGFVVRVGDSFVLMTFGSENGQFSTLDLPTLTAGEMWRLAYDATDLTLSAVPSPEPASFLLLGSGLLGAFGLFRRKIDL